MPRIGPPDPIIIDGIADSGSADMSAVREDEALAGEPVGEVIESPYVSASPHAVTGTGGRYRGWRARGRRATADRDGARTALRGQSWCRAREPEKSRGARPRDRQARQRRDRATR